jgi:hypothetical protein
VRNAIWIAPHDTHDWGRGMLSELDHVQGNWAALLWVIGGAGVLGKHAVLALMLPGSHRRTATSADELFAKERSMCKTSQVAIAACTVASLLLAPPFERTCFRYGLLDSAPFIHILLESKTCSPPESRPR